MKNIFQNNMWSLFMNSSWHCSVSSCFLPLFPQSSLVTYGSEVEKITGYSCGKEGFNWKITWTSFFDSSITRWNSQSRDASEQFLQVCGAEWKEYFNEIPSIWQQAQMFFLSKGTPHLERMKYETHHYLLSNDCLVSTPQPTPPTPPHPLRLQLTAILQE